VQTLFGKVQERVLESGLNVVNPMVDVVTFNIKTQNYTMSSMHDEGEQSADDAIRVLSKDGLEVIIDLTILYKVVPAKTPEILNKIGVDYQTIVIRPMARTQIRNNAVYYDAVSLYSTRRDEFQDRIFKGIEKDFADRGIILEELLVRNITLPESVKMAIESKINAEQEAQKMEFVLQKERQEAERKRVEAQGISDYQKIITATLSDKQLQYEMIKANRDIALSPNTKIIIMGSKGNQPLILNADK
jgi:regulator of protease activity HflC (stomatin/prohibitin superfamily)